MSLNSERDGQAESGIVDCYVYNQRFTHCYREFAHCPPPLPVWLFFNFFFVPCSHLQPRRLRCFWRTVRQKTRSLTRMCLLGIRKTRFKTIRPLFPEKPPFWDRFDGTFLVTLMAHKYWTFAEQRSDLYTILWERTAFCALTYKSLILFCITPSLCSEEDDTSLQLLGRCCALSSSRQNILIFSY